MTKPPKPPQLVSDPDYRALVAVALAFADKNLTDRQILIGIMLAMNGMCNPEGVKKEIAKQRSEAET
jgi:hypothetical protein